MESKRNYEQHYTKQLERIMETTVELALEEGIDALNISSIAKACNLSRPTIYRYFKTKEDILWGIFFQEAHKMERHIAARFSKDDTLYLRASKVAQGMIEFQLENENSIIYNDIFLSLYIKASEDISFDWRNLETNIYGFKPGHTIIHLFHDIIDLDQAPELKKTLVSFIYAASYLTQAMLPQDDALHIKYQMSSKEMLNKQINWLMEGLGRELEKQGYPADRSFSPFHINPTVP